MIGKSYNGYPEDKSCLTNFLAFYDEMTGTVDEGKAVNVVYLDFST